MGKGGERKRRTDRKKIETVKSYREKLRHTEDRQRKIERRKGGEKYHRQTLIDLSLFNHYSYHDNASLLGWLCPAGSWQLLVL